MSYNNMIKYVSSLYVVAVINLR